MVSRSGKRKHCFLDIFNIEILKNERLILTDEFYSLLRSTS